MIDVTETETVKHEIRKQVGGFFGMLLGTLGASMLKIILTGEGVLRSERGINNEDHIDKKF